VKGATKNSTRGQIDCSRLIAGIAVSVQMEAAMTLLRPNWPAGLPSPDALQTATEALSRHYVLAETLLEPVVLGEAIELAYLLSAYGLVPTQPQTAAEPSGMAGYEARKPSRTKGTLDRPRCTGRHARVDDDANAMELARA
jgi:hypothetical protein